MKANGYQLEYRWFGPQPREASTIVFLHEGLGCVELWRDFPERVSQATGCGVLVYSRAGYGQSDPIQLPRPIRFMHDEALITLPQVLDQLDIQDPILFGHSDGGSIALIHAGSEHGKHVRALVLEAPHVFVEDYGLKSIRAAGENYRSGSLRTKLARYHVSNVDCAFWGWNDVWLNPAFRTWNIEEYLPRIESPVLVIQGEDDEYGTSRQLDAVVKACGGYVRTVVLPQCGHSPHRDRPQATLEATKSFLNREILNPKPDDAT